MHDPNEYCPNCDMPYAEVWSDGRCGICDANLVAARTNPFAQALVAKRRKQETENREFVKLVRECRKWGMANEYPAAKDYPQYQKLREAGLFFYAHGGTDRMGNALKAVMSEMEDIGGRSWARFVEFAWKGIGGWAP